jgi:uncharacterized protein YdeI (YjbR/CyaY-like superfamily)
MSNTGRDARVDEYRNGLAQWQKELDALRPTLLGAGLTEELKWRKPCYTHDGKNIVIFQPFKDMCALMFFKGALLDDPSGSLREQGEHSRSALRLEFRSVAEVKAAKATIGHLAADAMRVADAGLKVAKAPAPTDRDYPNELVAAMEDDAQFREAFESLTPGRQRGYLIHFTAAKQSATRQARIERYRDRILEGFGMHD